MRMLTLRAALLAATPYIAKESCFWKFGWPALSDCECRQMGYKHGTLEFMQCYSVTLQNHTAGAAAAVQIAPLFLQPQPAPVRNCQTPWVAGGWQTTCF